MLINIYSHTSIFNWRTGTVVDLQHIIVKQQCQCLCKSKWFWMLATVKKLYSIYMYITYVISNVSWLTQPWGASEIDKRGRNCSIISKIIRLPIWQAQILFKWFCFLFRIFTGQNGMFLRRKNLSIFTHRNTVIRMMSRK